MKKAIFAGLAAAAVLTVAPAAAFAGGKHGAGTNAPQAGCTISGTSVGAPITLTGSGFAPSSPYGVVFTWSDGSATGVGTYSDSSGNLSVAETAYSATIVVTVQTGDKSVAACSTTV
jgi:hypothetical protein